MLCRIRYSFRGCKYRKQNVIVSEIDSLRIIGMNVLGGLGCMSGVKSTKGSTNIIVKNGVMKIEVKNEIVEDTKVTGYDMNPLFKKVIESLEHAFRDVFAKKRVIEEMC